MMFDYGSGWSGWDLAGTWILMLLFWGVVVWAVVAVVAVVTSGSRRHAIDRSVESRKILDRRLATGEINDDEYRQVRELLEGGNRQTVGAPRS